MNLYRLFLIIAIGGTLVACSGSSSLHMSGGGSTSGSTTGGSTGSTTGGTTGSTGGGTTGSTGGSTSSACTTMAVGDFKVTTLIDSGCASCSISNPSLVADNDLTTGAMLSVNTAAPGSGAAIRVTAQAGMTYPSGGMAGAFVSVPPGTGQSYSVTVRTLLAGVVQESNSSDNSGGGSGVTGGHGSAFDGILTTKAFDAVEVFINNNQVSGTPTFNVFELCSNHSAP